MSEEITIQNQIIKLLDQQPFHPFVIVMNSGDRYEVSHRHQVAVGKSVLILVAPDSTSVYMRSSQISSLEEMATA